MASEAPPQPRPAYETSSKSPLYVDRDFYSAVAAARRESVQKIQIAPRDGQAWLVPAGKICRISTPEGPQVGDLNIWNQHNASEYMWTARSRQLHSSHIRVFDRLWSVLPYMRPLVTVINNSLEDFGVDGSGGRVHDLLGTRCDPYIGKILGGDDFEYHCHSNLVRAIKPFGLKEFNVHDNVNLFQVTGLTNEDQYFM
ncbi:hypothetical protein LTR84_009848 [Exophiala bonariae]|uniref:DUF1989 domain-containing protein n=1 Tax=Exophiala bonariae TaxID=1690606 RepID=A0AAV9NM06_9EURO|nr:hypothetical protein LTR84_009848 [Exophiala bonariae]